MLEDSYGTSYCPIDFIFQSGKIVILENLQSSILDKLNASYLGLEKAVARVRIHMYLG